ncbi:AarF/UbiB family protein, partial [Desulfobacterales bacterium HSG16]|nr:AarF/UbiB family protein [Desulfobacterales bacterium HSG16]
MDNDNSCVKIDLKRYRKVRWFFAKVFLQTIWNDILLNRPILRIFQSNPLVRWKRIASKYRVLALEMGGVLIKMGQFLSIRVDILPPAVTEELAGLQDEVPPEKIEDITARIEADFNRPISEIFESISEKPLGAASLAQVHEVRIKGGKPRVVKVLRPNIEVLVETDLAAIRLAFNWLKHYRRVSKRVDLDWLADEFSEVTRNELDLKKEGHNSEKFAQNLRHDPFVHVPKIDWEYCRKHTLTMENVGYIKINDLKAMSSVGISSVQVVNELHRIYMFQVFENRFTHVDPHPGNLFVKPLPTPAEIESGIKSFAPNDPVPLKPGRNFQIAFVDFGMMASVPERLKNAAREFAIGFATRDARKIVEAYIHAGVLLEGADLKRLEEVHEMVFERFWGVRMGRMRDVVLNQADYFLAEYRDIIFEAPFQVQADMLFIMRAIGILSGMAANLDPDFDPWAKAMPFARRFAEEEMQKDWPNRLDDAVRLGHLAAGLPDRMNHVLTKLEQGKLNFRISPENGTRNLIKGLEKSIERLGWMVVATGLLISGVILHTRGSSQDFSNILIAG